MHITSTEDPLLGWSHPSGIENKRNLLRLTQQALAKESGVPQAVISRIENGRIKDPSYFTMQKIFSALSRLERHTRHLDSPAAEQLMSERIIAVKPNDRAELAWKLMKEHHFSQLPVIDDGGRILGCINEDNLLASTQDLRVKEIMSDPFPIVGKNTSIQTLASLLKNEPAVLVAEKGKAIGIVTKFDIIEYAYLHSALH